MQSLIGNGYISIYKSYEAPDILLANIVENNDID